MIDLLIIAPTDVISHSVPTGFLIADEIFSEAKLKDPYSTSPADTKDLQRALFYLSRKYSRRIRVSWILLWSLQGLWVVFRYRLRSFPAVIVNKTTVLTGDSLNFKIFIAFIESLLTQSN